MKAYAQFVSTLVAAGSAFAMSGLAQQPGALDLTFEPGSSTDAAIYALARQTDGKVVIGGLFTVADGEPRNRIARLNADGKVDTAFGNGLAGADGTVWVVAVQTNGTILIAGEFTTINGVTRNRIARLNPDGSLDTTFQSGLSGANGSVNALIIQSDGKVLIGGTFTTINGVTRNRIARLNADGSLDSTFQNGLSGANDMVRAIAVQPDGKVLIGGDYTIINGTSRNRIARLNTNGSLDTSFGAGRSGVLGLVGSIALQPNGRVIIGGWFTRVNGVTRTRIARLNADGSLDTTFQNGLSGANSWVYSMALQSDGKVVIGGRFTVLNGVAWHYISRLNTNGTVDLTFGESSDAADDDDIADGADGAVWTVALQTNGQVLACGEFTIMNGADRSYVARLNTDRSLDTAFAEGVEGIVGNRLESVAVQSDGKVVIAGDFWNVTGVTRSNIARLNTDGSVDTSFGNGQAGANSNLFSAMIQSNGTVLLVGNFTRVNGVTRNRVARLNADGSLDPSFGDGLAGADWTVRSAAVQSDGRILIAGGFLLVNGVPRNQVARLEANGSVDASFGDGVIGPNSAVYSVAVQNDGKPLVGGFFTAVDDEVRNRIARLNTNGTLDTTFGSGLSGADAVVRCIVVQHDGKALIGGDFTTVNDVTRNGIARLNPDGSLDTGFGQGLAGANGTVRSVALQHNGKVLIAGTFTAVNEVERNYIAQLNADGSLDTDFGSGLSAANNPLRSVAVHRDGKILLGGEFSKVNGVARRYAARLYGDTPLLSMALLSLDQARVSWPSDWIGFALQESAEAGLPWTDVGPSPTDDGTNWSVNLSTTNASRLFRLKTP